MTTRELTRIGIAEVEKRVGRERSTIGRWIREGRFPRPLWIGTRRAWDLAEVEAWVLSQSRPAKFNLPSTTRAE